MAVERWDEMIFIVCDLFNTEYNCCDAYLDGMNELPVQLVRIRPGSSNDTIKVREPQVINQVGHLLRDIHDMHGWEDSPPYKVDHADGKYPVYNSPRSLVYK